MTVNETDHGIAEEVGPAAVKLERRRVLKAYAQTHDLLDEYGIPRPSTTSFATNRGVPIHDTPQIMRDVIGGEE